MRLIKKKVNSHSRHSIHTIENIYCQGSVLFAIPYIPALFIYIHGNTIQKKYEIYRF